VTLADTTDPATAFGRGQAAPGGARDRARAAARDTQAEPGADKLSLAIVAGVRPNIPKIWTLLRGLRKLAESAEAVPRFEHTVVHTGQHYDDELGERFAHRFGVEVDINLGARGTVGTRLPDLLADLEACFDRLAPDLVFVIGDVNSTVAAATAAARREIPVVHVEAGLRSGGRDLEEINRKLITASSVVHLAPSWLAMRNLLGEGVPRDRIHVVGNTIAEAFLHHQAERDASGVLRAYGLEPGHYICFTVHKPETLARLPWVTTLLRRLGEQHRVIFPAHPRTTKAFAEAGIDVAALPGVRVVGPQPYAAIGALIENSRAVVTDSSGLQEESTIAGVPCATVSDRTARPETVLCGTNTIVGYDIDRCLAAVSRPLHRLIRPQYWDRGVSDRIATAMRTVMTDPAMAPAWVTEAREARDRVA
jgi:UDP-N-acetylglucosamine 2-epimerase (non-hydrolysing)